MTGGVPNPYDILGIPRSATDREIKRKYRLLAKKYHPDMNPDDPVAEQRFKQIQSAYEALKGGKTGKGNGETGWGHMAAEDRDAGLTDPFIRFFQAFQAADRFRTRTQAGPGDKNQSEVPSSASTDPTA